jgi:hypothetical protein
MRTRGGPSHLKQKNSEDFEELPKRYPEIKEFLKKNPTLSLLLEMETPNNVIVVKKDTLNFTLLDAVDKTRLQLVDKHSLHQALPNIPTPHRHIYKNLEELREQVKTWVGLEGIVLSYNKNQHRIKIKSDWYRKIHALKSHLNNPNHLLDFYLEANLPTLEELQKRITLETDYETAEELKPLAKKVCEAGEKTKKTLEHLRSYAQTLQNIPRKLQAQAILQNKREYSSILFDVLDNPLHKKIPEKQIKKIMEAFINTPP